MAINPMLLQALVGNAANSAIPFGQPAQAPMPSANPLGVSIPPPSGGFGGAMQNFQIAGGINALMGNPLFGAGMGLLSASQGGGNPYQAALAGMLGTTVYKRQQQEYDLKTQEAKMQREQLKTVAELATKALGTIDVDQDGNISPAEQARADYLKAAATTGDPQYLSKATETLASLQPKDQGPQSTIGKLAADLAAGRITPEQFNAGYQKAITSRPLVEINNSKPLGTDVINWRNAAGEQPNPLMTIESAYAAGFAPISPEERKAADAAGQAAPVIGRMLEFGGIGTDKSLFPKDDANIVERGIGGAEARYRTATADPNSPELIAYNTFKDATLSNLARLSGQVGTLTDLDVQMVARLWPTPGFTTESVADLQFRNIVGLLKARGLGDDVLTQIGIPSRYLSAQPSTTYSDLPED